MGFNHWKNWLFNFDINFFKIKFIDFLLRFTYIFRWILLCFFSLILGFGYWFALLIFKVHVFFFLHICSTPFYVLFLFYLFVIIFSISSKKDYICNWHYVYIGFWLNNLFYRLLQIMVLDPVFFLLLRTT